MSSNLSIGQIISIYYDVSKSKKADWRVVNISGSKVRVQAVSGVRYAIWDIVALQDWIA